MSMNKPKTSKHTSGAKKMVKLMAANELAFARLYHKYAVIFDDPDFWEELSRQEKRHAQWLETLLGSRDIVALSSDFLSSTAVEMMINAVEGEIDSAQSLTLIEALTRSLKFEKSFLENDYFEVFSLEAETVRKVIEGLKSETHDHINFIQSKIEEIKSGR